MSLVQEMMATQPIIVRNSKNIKIKDYINPQQICSTTTIIQMYKQQLSLIIRGF